VQHKKVQEREEDFYRNLEKALNPLVEEKHKQKTEEGRQALIAAQRSSHMQIKVGDQSLQSPKIHQLSPSSAMELIHT
jgi:hypothetical protein